MFALTLHTYSGMAIPIDDGDRDDCRSAAAQILRNRRKHGHHIAMVRRGHSWEIEGKDDEVLIGDSTGNLYLSDVRASCCECGGKMDGTDTRRMSESRLRYLQCADCSNPELYDDDDDDRPADDDAR